MKAITLKMMNPDYVGALASGLCLIHCAVTPFLFVAKAYSVTACSAAPTWWRAVDYIFLIVSFVAIYFTSKNASKSWVKSSLWVSWIVLAITILSESFHWGLVPHAFIYVPALAIVGLHIYNLKYCKCENDVCCTT
ncbi:MAG: MerC domain-containing protein [Bacteroidota bacterium]